MNCEDCQEILSEYIDNLLDEKKTARVKAHLTLCMPCAELHEDFASILKVYDLETTEEIPPPNEQALWCRINNIIECEIKPEVFEESRQKQAQRQNTGNWFSRLWHRTWALSFTQLASAVLGIMLISSLLTVISIRNASPSLSYFSGENTVNQQPSLFERALSKVGLAETPQQIRERRLHEQQAAVDYWNKRVAARRVQWDRNLRDAFDRNLNEIDQAVSEYTRTLETNPQDELSGEMLDSALNEKVELLREFSEL
jgi:hypothetical protein